MEIKVIPTPNPLSKKFVISKIINSGEKLEINNPQEAVKIKEHLTAAGEPYYEIGRVVRGSHDVTIKGGVFNE